MVCASQPCGLGVPATVPTSAAPLQVPNNSLSDLFGYRARIAVIGRARVSDMDSDLESGTRGSANRSRAVPMSRVGDVDIDCRIAGNLCRPEHLVLAAVVVEAVQATGLGQDVRGKGGAVGAIVRQPPALRTNRRRVVPRAWFGSTQAGQLVCPEDAARIALVLRQVQGWLYDRGRTTTRTRRGSRIGGIASGCSWRGLASCRRTTSNGHNGRAKDERNRAKPHDWMPPMLWLLRSWVPT